MWKINNWHIVFNWGTWVLSDCHHILKCTLQKNWKKYLFAFFYLNKFILFVCFSLNMLKCVSMYVLYLCKISLTYKLVFIQKQIYFNLNTFYNSSTVCLLQIMLLMQKELIVCIVFTFSFHLNEFMLKLFCKADILIFNKKISHKILFFGKIW